MLKAVQHNTAILIFAHSAAQEFERKPFAKNTVLFEALNKETLTKVKKTGLPYFHFTEKEQFGDTFGERFVNAIQEVYEKGYKNVITIGNDSPQLKTSHLLEANKQLELGKTVLGPTFDGGFYLMGLQKSTFDASLFERLPWQRFGLFNRISQLFENSNSNLFRLPVFEDIDTEKDAVKLLSFFKSISITILDILRALEEKVLSLFRMRIFTYFELFTSLLFNKGSPLVLPLS